MRAIAGCVGMILVLSATSGCLRTEVTHTIYLARSGAVWSVLERDVRSDEQSPADRAREEGGYAVAVAAAGHPVAAAFRGLGAQEVTTRWLRRERPYAVLTEGHFNDVRQLALAIIDAAHARGDVELVRAGCQTRFGVCLNLEQSGSKEDSPLEALMDDLETYRLVLTEGRFISADGFEILDGGSIAVPDGVPILAPASTRSR